MNPYRDASGQPMGVTMSPRPGLLGGPQQQMPGQPQQQPGPQGMPPGMGRGANNPGLQASVLAMANNVYPNNPSQQIPQGELHEMHNLTLLNSYIYDHLIKHGLYKAAKGLWQETDLHPYIRERGENSSPNQDNEGGPPSRRATNLKRSHSGMDDHPNSSPNDKNSPRSTSTSPNQGHNDLPVPNVPLQSAGGFLTEWWAVFWDVFAARSNNENASFFAQAYLENQVSLYLVF